VARITRVIPKLPGLAFVCRLGSPRQISRGGRADEGSRAKGEEDMQNTAALRKSDVGLVPLNAVVPASFVEALKQGWKFAHDSTCLSIDKRHRDGTVTLVRPGFSKLFVPYTASVKQGYSFGKPRLA
jgi:hypothetical protein